MKAIWIITFLATLLFDLHWGLISAFVSCIGALVLRSIVAHTELVKHMSQTVNPSAETQNQKAAQQLSHGNTTNVGTRIVRITL